MRDSPRIVIIGIGNESRGDDALGPWLVRSLAGSASAHLTLLEDYQLQIEHALDLVDADLVLFIDAGTGTPAPWHFYEATADAGHSVTSHALSPEAVLQVYSTVHGAPPPAFVLCVRGETFGLGESLSVAATAHLSAAQTFLHELLIAPSAPRWRAHLSA